MVRRGGTNSGARGLSHDLYSLAGDEPCLEVLPGEARRAYDDFRRRYLDEQDFDAALEALRRMQPQPARSLLLYMRGRCWSALGHRLAASWFFEKAADLAPEKPNYRFIALDALVKAGRSAEALERAHRILQGPADEPAAVIGATKVLLDTADAGVSEASDRLPNAVQRLSAALARIDPETAPDIPDSLVQAGLVYLAMAQERIGDIAASRASYDRALAAQPRSSSVRAARGLFRLRHDPSEFPADDFREAIALGTPLIHPYLFLAHHLLQLDDFLACRRVCAQALEMPLPAGLRANLLEWRAICRHANGEPVEAVRADFEEARLLTPSDQRLARNIDTFEQSLRHPASAALTSSVFSLSPAVTPLQAQQNLRDAMRPAA